MVKPLVWGIIGGVIGVIFLIIVVFYYETESDDARLAQIESWYDYNTDRLTVTILLTDSNGDYTKANGDAEITIQKDGRMVYSDKYYFVKDDFVSWKDNFGGKITGYTIGIRQFFSSGSHDVFVDLNTKSLHWDDLHDSFYSLEQALQQAPETVQRMIPQQAPETVQRMIPQQTTEQITQSCSGSAGCFTGIVTRVVDGDTILSMAIQYDLR